LLRAGDEERRDRIGCPILQREDAHWPLTDRELDGQYL
jgi:hypothetical protein